ncbi:hypothetical protein [Mesorhizobium opportunistum]|nr:hypothetical protein [Mesorhizobium opportunistum]
MVGAFWVLCAFAMLALALTFFVDDPKSQHSLVVKAVMVLFQLFGLYWAPFFSAAALLAFLDARLVKPALIVRPDRLIDNRSGLSVEWVDVLSARPITTRAGYWGVTLRMRDSALLPKSIRLGYPLLRRRRGEVHLQCNLLSLPSHQIANAIFTLAQHGGAQLLPPRPALTWNSPPPTVPQQWNSDEATQRSGAQLKTGG